MVDGEALPVAEMLDRLIDDTAGDARSLGCTAEIERCRTIVGAGTSADAQLAVFEAHKECGDEYDALRAVSDWIAVTTLQ